MTEIRAKLNDFALSLIFWAYFESLKLIEKSIINLTTFRWNFRPEVSVNTSSENE